MRVGLLALLSFALTVPQAPGLGESLNDYVTLFAGAGAVDCGQVGFAATDAALQQLIDCGRGASRRGQPFRAEQRTPQSVGLIGNASGVVYHFRTTAGCADGSCPPMFSVARCPNPSADRGNLLCYVPGPPAVGAQKPEEYLELVAGSGAMDCGRLGIRVIDGDIRRALDCAFEAHRRKDAFTLVKQNQGIDSDIYEGLVGDPAGTIYFFAYDSAPCGGPQCYGRFSLGKCPAPTTSITQNRLRFSCRQ